MKGRASAHPSALSAHPYTLSAHPDALSAHPDALSSALRLSEMLAPFYPTAASRADSGRDRPASSALLFLCGNRRPRSFLNFRITQLSSFWMLMAELFQIQGQIRTSHFLSQNTFSFLCNLFKKKIPKLFLFLIYHFCASKK